MCCPWTTWACCVASAPVIFRATRSAGVMRVRWLPPGRRTAAWQLGIFGGRWTRCLLRTERPPGRAFVEQDHRSHTLAKKNFLDFEQPIAELETKSEELRYVQTESAVDISSEIEQLGKKSLQLTKDIYSNLTPWQITKIARHSDRPYTLDYVREVFTHRVELHGDRHFADDLSIVGGLARFNGHACMVLGQQKGRDTKERAARNFGMTKPEGYRKALRLMKLAEKFRLPVFTFIDTPGAYPGIDAEERGQSEAIGRNMFEMAQLEVPIITTIIGEGGSGGALAISVADQVLMLQYSIYSVISPEGCASILWKTGEKAELAAEALGITAHRLKSLNLVDKIVSEPVGGTHRDHEQMMSFLKRALADAVRQVSDLKPKELLDRRYERLQSYGRFTDTKAK